MKNTPALDPPVAGHDARSGGLRDNGDGGDACSVGWGGVGDGVGWGMGVGGVGGALLVLGSFVRLPNPPTPTQLSQTSLPLAPVSPGLPRSPPLTPLTGLLLALSRSCSRSFNAVRVMRSHAAERCSGRGSIRFLETGRACQARWLLRQPASPAVCTCA